MVAQRPRRRFGRPFHTNRGRSAPIRSPSQNEEQVKRERDAEAELQERIIAAEQSEDMNQVGGTSTAAAKALHRSNPLNFMYSAG